LKVRAHNAWFARFAFLFSGDGIRPLATAETKIEIFCYRISHICVRAYMHIMSDITLQGFPAHVTLHVDEYKLLRTRTINIAFIPLISITISLLSSTLSNTFDGCAGQPLNLKLSLRRPDFPISHRETKVVRGKVVFLKKK
jgi:hypothetical protein